MTAHFNGLTPAEAERIAKLAEEAAEVVQACMKILRHGFESYNPDLTDGKSNREMLAEELTDLHQAMDWVIHCGDVPNDLMEDTAHRGFDTETGNVLPMNYMHHQPYELADAFDLE